jgi:GTP-binding protein
MEFQNACFELSAGTSSGLPWPDRPEIAFSGRSNVGKSSMINKLLNRKSLARTSSSPGKTATVNFYNIGFCRFADLPGYGYAKVPREEKLRWAELVEEYFASQRDMRLVVQIIDARRAPAKDDVDMVGFLHAQNIPFILAASKCDKLNASERRTQTKALQDFCRCQNAEFLFFSTLTGEGVQQLRKKILSVCRG